jgi:molybdopterin-containing oxidoreductase family membrane subunit
MPQLLKKAFGGIGLLIWAGLGGLATLAILMIPGVVEATVYVPWGIMVSTYVFMALSTTGLCIISSIGSFFLVERYELVARRSSWLALITILLALFVIAMDLGVPWRGHSAFIGFANMRSIMYWMIMLYMLYLVFLLPELWLMLRRDLAMTANAASGIKRWFYRVLALGTTDDSERSYEADKRIQRIVAGIAVSTVIVAHTTLGAIFGVLQIRPLWSGLFTPVYFIFSAIISGAAYLPLATIGTYKIRGREMSPELRNLMVEFGKILIVLILLDLFAITFLHVWKYLTVTHYELMSLEVLTTGGLAAIFWIFEVGGRVVPLALLCHPKTRKSMSGIAVATFILIIALFTSKYDLVVAGLLIPITPTLPALEGVAVHYIPGIVEASFVVGVFGMLILAYAIGEVLLPLEELGGQKKVSRR